LADIRKVWPVLPLIAVATLLLAGHHRAWGGVIETATRFAVAADSDGTVRIRGTIRNAGNETAFDVRAAFILLESVYGTQDLGDLSPGGATAVEYTIPDTLSAPGHYILVVNIGFEERSGLRHAVHHVYPFDLAIRDPEERRSRLRVVVNNPRYNRRAWLNRPMKIGLLLDNRYPTTVDAVVALIAPSGIDVATPTLRLRLPPGVRVERKIAVRFHPENLQSAQYGVLVHYRHNGRIHSYWIDAGIEVQERPFVFALFALAATLFLLILGIRAAAKSGSAHQIKRWLKSCAVPGKP
jgi:hypothetical protein